MMAFSHLSYELEMVVTWGDCDAAGISLVCLKADSQYKKMVKPLEKIKEA